jgi:hypothetical protein
MPHKMGLEGIVSKRKDSTYQKGFHNCSVAQICVVKSGFGGIGTEQFLKPAAVLERVHIFLGSSSHPRTLPEFGERHAGW